MRPPFSSFSIRLTKTSSIDGVMGSSDAIVNPGAVQRLREFAAIARSGVVHFHVQSAAEHRDVQNAVAAFEQRSCCPADPTIPDSTGGPAPSDCLQLRGRAERDHAAAVHQRDAMAVFGFVHVMRGDEDGVAGRGKLVDQLPEVAARDGIDAAGRLVQKQNRRLVQDRAAQRQAELPI